MALPENKYTVLSKASLGKRPKEGWLQMLRQWLVKCPQCWEVRLVIGVREHDKYVCKDCGHGFAVKLLEGINVYESKQATHKTFGVKKMKRKSKKAATIYVTELDYDRLTELIDLTRQRNGVDKEYLNKLEAELDRAEIVDPKHIPADVITMRSKVRLKDLVSGETNTYSLVFPTEADFTEGKISVLAPIGTAILGYRLGDTIEWPVPSGLRTLKVEKILYQPESAGDHSW